MSHTEPSPAARACAAGTRVLYFAPGAGAPLPAVVLAAAGSGADQAGIDPATPVTAAILIWEPPPPQCLGFATQTALGWALFGVPRADTQRDHEMLELDLRFSGRWTPVGVAFWDIDVDHEPVDSEPGPRHHVHQCVGSWFYSHGWRSAGPFASRSDAAAYATGRQVDPERLIPAEVPFRLHPAFAWISISAGSGELEALGGDALAVRCRQLASAAARAGVEGVDEQGLLAIVAWLREEAPAAAAA